MSVMRLTLILLTLAAAFAQPARHPMKIDDLARFRDVRDPQCSPDGRWVAYTVSTIDAKEDKRDTDVWMVSLDGKRDLRLTSSPESESSPRWSPDGKYLAFLSSRPGKAKGNQVWLLDREGGEAVQLTDVKGRLLSYEWSPDSKRLALVAGDPDPDAEPLAEGAKAKAPKPIVIDRYHFKQDGAGYLLSTRHSYIYLFDIATKKLDRLTKSKRDESSPVWSPDGARIVFLSNHHEDPDRDPGNQIYVAAASAGAAETRLTPLDFRIGRSRPEWSPDGKTIAFLIGESEKKFEEYGMDRLAVISSDGSGQPSIVRSVADLDRGVSSPRFSPDGALP
jgi:Tol biopolymer transport system component